MAKHKVKWEELVSYEGVIDLPDGLDLGDANATTIAVSEALGEENQPRVSDVVEGETELSVTEQPVVV